MSVYIKNQIKKDYKIKKIINCLKKNNNFNKCKKHH